VQAGKDFVCSFERKKYYDPKEVEKHIFAEAAGKLILKIKNLI